MNLRKAGAALVPAFPPDAEAIAKFKLGDVITADVHRPRNGKFFAKWWALATLLYDLWSETCEPQEYRGESVQPNFERFRHDLTILAGYYTPVYAVNGEVRLEAKSLSWARMSESEFEALYSATIDVALRKIIPKGQHDEQTLRSLVDEVMSFA